MKVGKISFMNNISSLLFPPYSPITPQPLILDHPTPSTPELSSFLISPSYYFARLYINTFR